MNINFKIKDVNNEKEMRVLTEFYNDNTLNYLYTPNFEEKPLQGISYEKLISMPIAGLCYVILDGDKIIGDVSLDFNFKYLLSPHEKTAWLSIAVMDKSYHGKGIGKLAVEFVENIAKEKGYDYMELGVFSFNTKAIGFYERLGYTFLTKVSNFTYHNGKWHDDFRYIKKLVSDNKQ